MASPESKKVWPVKETESFRRRKRQDVKPLKTGAVRLP
jgi:hypothetical protein